MALSKRLSVFVKKQIATAAAPDLIQKSQALALQKVREIKTLTADGDREIFELADAAALNIMIVEQFLRRGTK